MRQNLSLSKLAYLDPYALTGNTAALCLPAGQWVKKIKGRKRHIITDTIGLMLFVVVHAAYIQVRDGAPDVLKSIRGRFPWLRHVFADGGYAGEKLRTALKGHGDWTIKIIKRSDTARGFEVLPRRWVVERTFAWLGRCRRLAKDWEQSIESSTAWALIANIRFLTRRNDNLINDWALLPTQNKQLGNTGRTY